MSLDFLPDEYMCVIHQLQPLVWDVLLGNKYKKKVNSSYFYKIYNFIFPHNLFLETYLAFSGLLRTKRGNKIDAFKRLLLRRS